MAWHDSGEAWAQDAIVCSGEEESGAPTEIGKAVSMAFGQAVDDAVQAQTAQLVGDGAAADGLGRAAS